MIWFALGLFAVSFLLTALLAPKPNLEDARPESLDPNNFPMASENSPVTFLLGCGRVKGPNTLWYGNYQSIPITEKVKTGLFSSSRVTVGYTYRLSIDLGLALGPNLGLKKILIDSVEVNEGVTYYSNNIELNYYSDDTLPFTTNIAQISDHEEIELTAALGLTTDALDTLLAQGGLKISYQWSIYAIETPLAGGGPAIGNYTFFVRFMSTSQSATTIFPPEGQNAEDQVISVNSGGPFRMEFDRTVTIPVGTRFVSYTGQFIPTLPLFTLLDTDLTDGVGLPEGAPASDGNKLLRIFGQGVDITGINFDINEPGLYGGYKQGGGHVGNVEFYPGNFDQAVDTHVEGFVGAGNVPAYRGIAHMVWKDHDIGESPQLRKVEFECFKYTDTINNGFGGRISDGGDDMDPAEAMYFILTDTWAGLGIDPNDIDISSFRAASSTLISEGNGVTVVVSASQTGAKVLQEILRQIDGIMYQDGASGQIKLVLIRNDYDVATLPIYDEDDIIAVRSFSKTTWTDVKSQVKVTYQSNATESTKVAIAQNMATANMLGILRTSEITFPFCYSATTANELAARELSVLSTPLFRMQVQMKRTAYNLKPGEVIKISWPEYGLSEIVMRVQKIDIGELLDNKVVVDVVQDIFAVATVVFANPVDTSWSDDRPVPETLTTTEVVEMPYFFSSRLETPVPDGQADVVPFALQPKTASTAYSFLSGIVTGTLETYEPDGVEYPLTGLLVGAYDQLTGFETGLDAAGITVDNLTGPNTDTDVPAAATTAEIRTGEAGIIYVGGEWMAYEGVTDNLNGSYTLTNVRRALLGGRPLTHADNSRVWFLDIDLLGEGNKAGDLLETGTLYYKYLDRVGSEQRGASLETEQSQVMQDIADRPLRPRNLQIDGARSQVPYDLGSDLMINLTWVNSNRAADQITFENDATETPDQAEQYDLEVYIDDVLDGTRSATNVTSPHALDFTGASGSTVDIRLYAARTGGDTKRSVEYAWYPGTLDSLELLSGDQADTASDYLLTSGDQQSGSDGIKLSGDQS